MDESVGNGSHDEALYQPGAAPADDEQVGVYLVAEVHDCSGRVAQFLAHLVVDTLEVDFGDGAVENLFLCFDQRFRQCSGGRWRSTGAT